VHPTQTAYKLFVDGITKKAADMIRDSNEEKGRDERNKEDLERTSSTGSGETGGRK